VHTVSFMDELPPNVAAAVRAIVIGLRGLVVRRGGLDAFEVHLHSEPGGPFSLEVKALDEEEDD